MPDFVPPQLCRLVEAPPSGPGWVHEVKFDGYRMQLRVEGGRARARTRKALDWSARFPEIVTAGAALPDCLIDGEIVALNERMPDFAALQDALSRKKTANLLFFIFDLLFLKGVDVREEPLSSRKDLLKALLDSVDAPRLRYVDHFTQRSETLLQSACRAHLEGIVSKRLDAPYRSGRGDLWTKAKCRGGQEIVIGGWRGTATTLRSILAGVWRGEDFVYLGRIGTGFNSENSALVLRALKPLKRASSPFTAGVNPPRAQDIIWVEPKLAAEIAFATITADGLLRQASFKALREDKPARGITLEIPVAMRDAEDVSEAEAPMTNTMTSTTMTSTRAQATTSKRDRVEVAGITITHPDKILWPAAKGSPDITKRDLALYYALAAQRMLPHIALRPISLVRAPEGIGGERFFQRHVLTGAGHVTPMRVAGEKSPFHAIDGVEGLVALAQAAVVEIHPWGAKKNAPEIPERLIFDLDPAPDLPFDAVVAAARTMREALSACGFTPFVKTTGGKGLHVVVAIKGTAKTPPAWDDAKDFARTLCERVAAAEPGRFVTNMAKKQRGGKIFLDYLRNGRMATAIAPYSPRARDGAPVAFPLPWSRVRKGLDPAVFTIASVPSLLKRADPWADLAASAAPLAAARKKLAKL
jgi:bifunctional non-homologous end joining protein LigD